VKIGFTYDLKNLYIDEFGFSKEDAAEFDEKITIDSIKNSLIELGHEVDDIGSVNNLLKKLIDKETWDFIFNISEGIRGYSRESLIPSLLEHYNIPYTFSDSHTLTLCLNKYLSKIYMEKHSIKTPLFKLISKLNDIENIDYLNYPLFIKPVNEGTGKGINKQSKVNNYQELKKQTLYLIENYKGPFLLEEYIEGKEITVGLSPETYYGAVELVFKNTHNFYCYENKKDYTKYVEHQNIEENSPLYLKIKKSAYEVFKCFNLKDIARIDMRIDKENTVYIIEINPIPGLNPIDSELPILAYKNNFSYQNIIENIIKETMKRI